MPVGFASALPAFLVLGGAGGAGGAGATGSVIKLSLIRCITALAFCASAVDVDFLRAFRSFASVPLCVADNSEPVRKSLLTSYYGEWPRAARQTACVVT